MTNIPKKYQELLDQFPFLTLISYGGNEYVGIIQNMDNNLASMYNYNNIKETTEKKEFLQLGEEWWWGTNRMIPINIIFKSSFEKYRKFFVFGDMKELGYDEESFHTEVGQYAVEKADILFTVGKLAKNAQSNSNNFALSLHFNDNFSLLDFQNKNFLIAVPFLPVSYTHLTLPTSDLV